MRGARATRGWGLGACATALLLAGCLMQSPDRSRYERDGIQYGVTEGRFRGRWWNYYERGRSYSDGQFWAEAERDLRAALAGRGTDQYWPRTYGLHFTPEYFPHRELGVVLYQQGRLAEAVEELALSYGQQPSARAAYYLDRARARRIEIEGIDMAAPTVEVLSPATAPAIGATRIEVAGVARDDTFVSEVMIGDETYPVDVAAREIPFERSVALRPGANAVAITVTDLAGRTTTTSVEMHCDVDGPAVSFDAPVVVPGTIRGVAFDTAGVKRMRLGGREAALEAQADGLVQFSVALHAEDLEPPLVYECEDTLGNVTRGVVPTDALVVGRLPDDAVFASDSVSLRPVAGRLSALEVGGRTLAYVLAATPVDEAPAIRFLNLDPEGERRYWTDEIVVGVRVEGADPIESVALNGAPVTGLIPGRKSQSFSRRVLLEAPGENEILVAAADTQGRTAERRATVQRELTKVEQLSERLSVAVLGSVWEGDNPQRLDEVAFISDALTRTLEERGRFQVVARDQIAHVLTEQELVAALGDKGARFALRAIVPAELMLAGKIRRDAETIHIVVQATCNETAVIMGYADVAGPADSLNQLEGLAQDLAVRLEQEFPRVQGLVAQVRSPSRLVTSLTQADGVRSLMKCLVFRKGEPIPHPMSGELLESDVDVLGYGFFDDVKQTISTVELLPPEEGAATPPIGVRDLVLTK